MIHTIKLQLPQTDEATYWPKNKTLIVDDNFRIAFSDFIETKNYIYARTLLLDMVNKNKEKDEVSHEILGSIFSYLMKECGGIRTYGPWSTFAASCAPSLLDEFTEAESGISQTLEEVMGEQNEKQ